MNNQEFSNGSKGLHLFLDYKGKDLLSQAFMHSTSVSQYKP